MRVLGVLLLLIGGYVETVSAQCTLICRSSLNLSLPANGESIITPEILLANPSCNPEAFYVHIMDEDGQPLGNTISCNEVGQTLNAGVFHNETGVSCFTTIQVFDYFAPQVDCRDTLISCMADYSVAALGQPTVTDNCEIVSFTHTDQMTTADCFTENSYGDTITATVARTWTATDASGNTTACTQYIFLKRATVNEVVFPANMDDVVSPSIDCGDDPNDLALTGEPRIDGHPIMTGGHCELITTFSDFDIDICGGSRRILRTWRVVDYCTGQFKEHIQIIKLTDSTPPVLDTMDDFEASTNVYSCDATVILPTLTATDDCSTVTVTPTWSFGMGYGPFQYVPVGTHLITYIAEDACGNTASQMVSLTIVDEVIPAMVCEGHTQVTLDNQGLATVDAAAFDDGSYDNCALDYFEVSRDGGPFLPYGEFDCNDVGQTILITLRAVDFHGNANTCDMLVDVMDNIKPVVACPQTMTLDCMADYEDLTVTGYPTVLDGCGVDTIFYQDNVDLNDCMIGTVLRLWTAIDVNGNQKTCVQQILIQDNEVMDIVFPEDYTTYDCQADLSEDITGVPQLPGKHCKDVSVVSEDLILPVSMPACYSVLRTWTVINWCVYEPNSGSQDGYYTYTQLLTVNDTVAPALVLYNDTIVGVMGNDCTGGAVSLPPVVGMDCSHSITITNNSPYADANGADASGTYPIGVHDIVFTATDACGNIGTQTATITVVDRQPPVAACVGELTVAIESEGFTVIYPYMVNAGSTDNCSYGEGLRYALSQDTLTCDDLGQRELTLFVEDVAGNVDSCTVIVNVTNDHGGCVPTGADLYGVIQKENGFPVSGVTVYLGGDQVDSTQTDVDGSYVFENLPLGGNYEITPYNNDDVFNGVSTIDLLFQKQYILGVMEELTPYRQIAADVNRSKIVSSLDMIQVRRVLLRLDSSYPFADSWMFVDAYFDFSQTSLPLRADYGTSLLVENLQENIDTLDFVGIKIGDLNDNGNSSMLTEGGETRSEDETTAIVLENQMLDAGRPYEIPVTIQTTEDVLGMQFSLETQPVIELQDIRISASAKAAGWTRDHFNLKKRQDGQVLLSWNSDALTGASLSAPIFYLQLKSKETVELSETISIGTSTLRPEIYLGADMAHLNRQALVLIFEKKTDRPIVSSLLTTTVAAFPNPVTDHVVFSMEAATEAVVELTIYDGKGQLIWSRPYTLSGDKREIKLERGRLGQGSGIRFYSIWMPSAGRMVSGQLVVKSE